MQVASKSILKNLLKWIIFHNLVDMILELFTIISISKQHIRMICILNPSLKSYLIVLFISSFKSIQRNLHFICIVNLFLYFYWWPVLWSTDHWKMKGFSFSTTITLSNVSGLSCFRRNYLMFWLLTY